MGKWAWRRVWRRMAGLFWEVLAPALLATALFGILLWGLSGG